MQPLVLATGFAWSVVFAVLGWKAPMIAALALAVATVLVLREYDRRRR